MMQKEPCEVDVPVREGGQPQNPMEKISGVRGTGSVCQDVRAVSVAVVRAGLVRR